MESLGTVDGPGIRFVIFMQGCPLRCSYCHNPDTWKISGGREMDSEEVFDEIRRLKNYFHRSGGGVTVTGGEALLQSTFVREIFSQCHKYDIHTCLDTSGFIWNEETELLLEETDLVLLDTKAFSSELHRKLTGVDNKRIFDFASKLRDRNIPFWTRFVLIPGLTDDEAEIRGLAGFFKEFDNLELVEVLPFHQLGAFKWENLGIEYRLQDVSEPTKEQVDFAVQIFQEEGLKVRC